MELIRSFILGVMAILPAFFLVYLIYKKDSIEKEPIRLIGFVGLLGALTVLGAGLLEHVAISMLHISNPTLSHFIECFFIIALVEEGGKLFVTYISVWKHPEFNYRFDGIVYAVSASAGFAIVENLFYIFQNENSFSVAILRAITAIPGHIVFGIVMGLFIGMAKYYKGLGDNTMKSFCLVLALIGPMVVHGLYDFILFGLEENEGNVLLLFGYIIFQDIIGILILFNSAKKDVPISGMMPQMQGIMPNGMYQQMQGRMPNGMMPQMQSGMPNGMYQQMPNGMPNGMYQQMQSGMPNGMYQQMQSGMPNGMMPQMQSGMPNGMMPQMQSGMPNGMMPQMRSGMTNRNIPVNKKRVVYGNNFFEDDNTVCLSNSEQSTHQAVSNTTTSAFPNSTTNSMNYSTQMGEEKTVVLGRNDFGQDERTVALNGNLFGQDERTVALNRNHFGQDEGTVALNGNNFVQDERTVVLNGNNFVQNERTVALNRNLFGQDEGMVALNGNNFVQDDRTVVLNDNNYDQDEKTLILDRNNYGRMNEQ
ncbi:MAG: PrsW family intramembrane metalloprotease [Lachnospiraceae bacterium]|nr:PrsW family intramembrane metalloprotease [Lachnospiraceae bacterium]